MRHRLQRLRGPAVAAAALMALIAGHARGQVVRSTPDELEGVGVTEHLGDRLPLNLQFVDDQGKTVHLGDYFGGDRPVILSLGYFRCPMLCSYVWNGLVDGIRDLEWTAGQEFEIVIVSIDPKETPDLAAAKKANYVKSYGRPSSVNGWHFLTGGQEAITTLAKTVGFDYKFIQDRNEFAHTAVLFVISPGGKIVRYLYGVMQEPKTVRFSLLEASEGKIGSTLDRVILYCFHYDAKEGRYTPVAMRVMRVMGAITIAVLGSFLLVLWRVDRRRRRKTAATGSQ